MVARACPMQMLLHDMCSMVCHTHLDDCQTRGRQSTCRTLENEVTAKTTFKGKLDTYRFCDNVRPPACLCKAASMLA